MTDRLNKMLALALDTPGSNESTIALLMLKRGIGSAKLFTRPEDLGYDALLRSFANDNKEKQAIINALQTQLSIANDNLARARREKPPRVLTTTEFVRQHRYSHDEAQAAYQRIDAAAKAGAISQGQAAKFKAHVTRRRTR